MLRARGDTDVGVTVSTASDCRSLPDGPQYILSDASVDGAKLFPVFCHAAGTMLDGSLDNLDLAPGVSARLGGHAPRGGGLQSLRRRRERDVVARQHGVLRDVRLPLLLHLQDGQPVPSTPTNATSTRSRSTTQMREQ